MTNSSNPLFKHFRQPQIYLRLPSQGRWYEPGSLDMPVTGELPVYAMTAKDELTLKTPDALLNGQATVDVIQSCLPNIKDAWKVPSVDLDAILIAIRQATYGPRLELMSLCPHCQTKNEHDINLQSVADQIVLQDFESTIKIKGLEIFLKPQNYKDFNKTSLENFEQQRVLNVVNDTTLSDEEKLIKFNLLFKKLLELTVSTVSKSVGAIKTEDGTLVEDTAMIDEFFVNCDKEIWNSVKQRLEQMGEQNPLKNIPLVCENEECLKPYTTPLLFETSSFFA